MQMQIPEWLTTTQTRPTRAKSSFAAYLDSETERFEESLRDAADNHWHEVQWQMLGADEEEINAEMERWWDENTRRFRAQLRAEHRRNQRRRLVKLARRERRLRVSAQSQLEAIQIKLQETEAELAAEREASTYLREEWRCRDCSQPWY